MSDETTPVEATRRAEEDPEATGGTESDDADTQPGQPGQEAAEDGAGPKRIELTVSLPLAIALAALLVVAVAAGVTFGWLFKAKADEQAAADAALETARSFAATVTSYDYQNIDRNVSDVLDGATGEFKDQYSGASTSLRQLITEAKATAEGDVVAAGVKSATTDRAEILLFVDQSVTNAATDKPRTDRNRIVMSLEKHDDRWLISGLELM